MTPLTVALWSIGALLGVAGLAVALAQSGGAKSNSFMAFAACFA